MGEGDGYSGGPSFVFAGQCSQSFVSTCVPFPVSARWAVPLDMPSAFTASFNDSRTVPLLPPL
jgi:hypothetical protein